MSQRGKSWRKGGANALRLIADQPRGPRLALEAHSGQKRVLVLTPAGEPAMTKLGLPDGDGVWIKLFGKDVRAVPFKGHPEAPGCRHVVTMPPRHTEEDGHAAIHVPPRPAR